MILEDERYVLAILILDKLIDEKTKRSYIPQGEVLLLDPLS